MRLHIDNLKYAALSSILGLVLMMGCGPESKTEEIRPNILILMSDNHSWNHLGCYGDPVIKTPNIDKLSEQGQPFCYWYSSRDPHRPFKVGGWEDEGIATDEIVVPPYLPDNDDVRMDMGDYYAEIQNFDRDVTSYREVRDKLSEKLTTHLKELGDPRELRGEMKWLGATYFAEKDKTPRPSEEAQRELQLKKEHSYE